MTERTAILHIGQNKTGSTSIQYAIAGHDDGAAFTAPFKSNNHSDAMYTAFSDDPGSYWLWEQNGCGAEEVRRRKERYLAEFSAMLKRRDRRRIVVSAEGIWGLRDAEKTRLVEFIHRHDWRVHVVAYVREPAGWAASMLSNHIRNDGWAADFSRKSLNPRYRLGLEAFAKLLPSERLNVRVFDPSRFEGSNPVRDFCDAVGLDPALSGGRNIHWNENASLPAMKLLVRFNRSGILDRRDAEVNSARIRFVETVMKKYSEAERLDPALCEGIVEYSDTDWLYENFGVDFRPPAHGSAQKPPPARSAADLEAVLSDLSDVDLSGLDECLAAHGIRPENFTAAEQKLHRLFYAALAESAILKRPAALFWGLARRVVQKLRGA